MFSSRTVLRRKTAITFREITGGTEIITFFNASIANIRLVNFRIEHARHVLVWHHNLLHFVCLLIFRVVRAKVGISVFIFSLSNFLIKCNYSVFVFGKRLPELLFKKLHCYLFFLIILISSILT
jgi:hypothetical protein